MPNVINATSTGNGGLITQGDDSGILNIQTNETTAITVDTSQNVGIGTASPADGLNIGVGKKFRATHSASVYQQIFSSSSGNFLNAYGDNLQLTADSGAMYFSTTAGQPIVFQTTNTERMRIDSSGNIITGNTSVSSINGGGGGSAFWNSGTNNIRRLQIGSNSTGSSQLTSWNTPNGEVGNITVSGVSTTYNTSSDYRLKEDIAPMTGALAKVSQLKPCTYKWKWNGSDGEGFIAHELGEVCPQAVTGVKDAVDEDGKPIHQSVDTSFLVATLTAAIQELSAKNDALTARIEALENR
jgi:hypothetical protein